MRRIERGVVRGESFTISIDGAPILAHPGETIAAAMLAAGLGTFRRADSGEPHGLFCNMGACCECMVWLENTGGSALRRVRACLVDARTGQTVVTVKNGDTINA
jgi:sarcosine oxidase subunit alpha